MKQSKLLQNLAIATILACIIIITKNITILPWWSFIIPVMIFGILLKLKKYAFPSFLLGFITGFLLWFFADLYFDVTLGGGILEKLGNVLSVHKTVIMSIAGLIGGLLNGLALYTGYLLIKTPVAAIEKKVW
ncbi:MAG: hypothetical protein WCF67_09060 [Chitinophagaceae bacterium]